MESILAKTSRKIGYTLRFYRRAIGLSQMDLANNAGLSFRNYQRLENGETLPRVDTLLRLAKELNLNPSTLMQSFESDAIGIQEISSADHDLFHQIKREISEFNSPNSFENLKALSHQSGEFHPFRMDGPILTVANSGHVPLNLPEPILDLDHHILGLKTVDFWEFIARKRLKSVKMVNLLHFPTGFHFLESFHCILSWVADAPHSIGYVRQHSFGTDFKQWILQHQALPLVSDLSLLPK